MAHSVKATTPTTTAGSPDAMFGPSNRLMEEVQRLHHNAARRPDGRSFTLGVRWNAAGTAVDYLYRQGQLICRSADLDTAVAAFAAIGQERPRNVVPGSNGITILDTGDRDAADLADALARTLGREDVVTPNHVLDLQGFPRMCPATEPVPSSGPVNELDEPAHASHVRVAVIDTGYLGSVAEQSGYQRFAAVTPDSHPDELAYGDDTDRIQAYGGHGTAATACLLAVAGAQSTTVHVDSCLVGGAVDEVGMIEAMTAAVESGADVISMQAGTYTRENVPPLAFTAFRDHVLANHPDTVVVTAAGNNGSDQEFWPAAFDWVTGVGGLTKNGDKRTDWSNHGTWVDVYAPGDNVTVPFPNGTYEYHGGVSTEFTDGHAIWSGTSFATPAVAGMIARRMIEDDVDAPAARDLVLAEAKDAEVQNIGPRVLP